MSGPTFQRLSRETLEQHGQIHFYLDQIAQSLGTLVPEMADVEPMRRLAAQIEGLKERLVEHYQAEEQGGLFHAVVELLPACRVEVDRLTSQHGKMIEILEMARLHAQHGDVSEAAELREDLDRFLGMFRRHERDEELLLAQAMEKDKG
jgi:hypothetical protein